MEYEGILAILIMMSIGVLLLVRGDGNDILSDNGFWVYVLSLVAFLLMMDALVDQCKITQYKQYRDQNYTDFSKDKEYKHWLIDHPK